MKKQDIILRIRTGAPIDDLLKSVPAIKPITSAEKKRILKKAKKFDK